MHQITDKQKHLLQQTTFQGGQNAWEYVQSWPKDEQYWIAVGILSCIEKGYSLNKLTVCWEARDLRYATSPHTALPGTTM